MAKVEKYICDIQNCEEKAEHIQTQIGVIFHTEQTEGRSVSPYISIQKLDICEAHMKTLLHANLPLHGSGAQGHNRYYFRQNKKK